MENEIDMEKFSKVIEETDEFIANLAINNEHFKVTELTAIVLSRLVVVNDIMECTESFNQLLKHILNRTPEINSNTSILH